MKTVRTICMFIIGVVGGIALIFLLNDLLQTMVEYFKYRIKLRSDVEMYLKEKNDYTGYSEPA